VERSAALDDERASCRGLRPLRACVRHRRTVEPESGAVKGKDSLRREGRVPAGA
jgi:hypothetical protein